MLIVPTEQTLNSKESRNKTIAASQDSQLGIFNFVNFTTQGRIPTSFAPKFYQETWEFSKVIFVALGLRVKILFTRILNSIQSCVSPMLPTKGRVALTMKGSGKLWHN